MIFTFALENVLSDTGDGTFAEGYNLDLDWVKLLYNKEFVIEWYTEDVNTGERTSSHIILQDEISLYGNIDTGLTFVPTTLLRHEMLEALKPEENVVVLVLHAGLEPDVDPNSIKGRITIDALNEAFKKRDLQMKYLEHKDYSVQGKTGVAGDKGYSGQLWI